jgi:hypothetical protein
LPSVFFYISGHGFGHASRQIEIINALGALRPDVSIVVRSSAPQWLFERTARVPLTFLAGECDTGVVQLDSLHLDEPETARRASAFYATLPQRANADAALLRQHDARLVITDAPPLGCSAASAAGIPSFVVTNFTWDWIYEAYEAQFTAAPHVLPAIRDAYGRAEAAWRLPMYGGFATIATIVDTPFVARHARHSRERVLATLRLPADVPLVLSSFGGYGVSGFDARRLDCLDRYAVIFTHRSADDEMSDLPAGVYQVSEAALYGSGLRYEDLVAACDVVATKPGFGIIAECIANDTAMLYTSRGHFVEYDVLVREMPRYLRCGYIDHDALFAGSWRQSLDTILQASPPPERPSTNGAAVIGGYADAVLRR